MTDESPEDEESTPSEIERDFRIPIWFRAIAIVAALALVVPSIIYVVRYSIEPKDFVSPVDLGVIPLIWGGVLVILLVLIPWDALGIRLRRVGFIEFDKVIKQQAQEHVVELAEMQARLDELEQMMRQANPIGPISEHLAEISLYPVLIKFLRQYSPTAFSPLRIKQWGSRQPGSRAAAQLPPPVAT